MKARKIYETIKFEEGGNPYQKLRIGIHRDIKPGDKFQITTNLYAIGNRYWTDDKTLKEEYNMVLYKGAIIIVYEPLQQIRKDSIYVLIDPIKTQLNSFTAINKKIFVDHPGWFKRVP